MDVDVVDRRRGPRRPDARQLPRPPRGRDDRGRVPRDPDRLSTRGRARRRLACAPSRRSAWSTRGPVYTTPNQVMRFVNGKGRVLAEINPTEEPFGWPRRNGFIQPLVDERLLGPASTASPASRSPLGDRPSRVARGLRRWRHRPR